MKKIIIIIWLLSLLIVHAQDRENSPLKFNYTTGGTQHANQCFAQDTFPQKNFIISTQWGGHPKLLKSLLFNATEDWQPRYDWGVRVAPVDPNYKMYYIWDGRPYRESPGFQFDPTLSIPSASRGQFFTKENDTTQSVFGFSTIRGTILSSSQSQDENYDRLILKHDSSYANGSIVLKKSWINNGYTYKSDPHFDLYNFTL